MFHRAAVTPEFLQKIKRLTHKLIYKTPAFKGGRKWLSVFGVFDPQDPNDTGFYYVERLGRDSVALLFYDDSKPDTPWIVLEQYHSPINQFVRGAFTGSMDKPELDATGIAVEEAMEEAGFHVDRSLVHEVGYEPVSATTNERVHLFYIDVSGLTRQRKQPENIFEENTRMYQLSTEQVLSTCEWKAKLIVLGREAQ